MVLKNSKWDKNAKLRYLKKHGLTRKPVAQEPTPKWSGKKTSASSNEVGQWTDDDEEVLNQMFPQLGSAELTEEQREKVKLQILADLLKENEEQQRQEQEYEKHRYDDGIYLGKLPEYKEEGEEEVEPKPLPVTLEEFISKDINIAKKLNRQLLSHKHNQKSVLEEYGIEDIKDTIKQDNSFDYNDVYRNKQNDRGLSKILNDELDGFKVGIDTLGTSKKISTERDIDKANILTKEEVELNNQMKESAEKLAFYHKMKSKFGDKKSGGGKILELNNININDEKQIDWLEKRIGAKQKGKIDYNGSDNEEEGDDKVLEGILGVSLKEETTGKVSETLDDLINGSSLTKPVDQLKSNPKPKKRPPPNLDFLDSILG